MNHIQNIEIKNFKSIRHQMIENCRRVNVFIGYPNTGKSNILEALSLFSINQNTKISSFFRFGSLATLFFNGNVENSFSVKINKKQQQIGFYQRDKVIVLHNLSNSNNVFEETFPKSLEEKKYFVLKNNEDVEFRRPKVYETLYFPEVLRYDFLKQILYKEGSHDFLNIPNGENLFSVIFSNQYLKNEIQELFKEFKLKLLYDLGSQVYLITKEVNDGIFSIPYLMIADTLQRLIFYKAAIASNKNSVLLFEEPEAHMFPPYISKFTSDIIYEENNNQYFITTHSPFVMNDFMENLEKDELAIYIVDYKNDETIIHRMNNDDMHEAYQFGYDFFLNIEKFISQEEHDKV